MSDATATAIAPALDGAMDNATPPGPRRMKFRSTRIGAALSREEAERERGIVVLAFARLGPDAARQFLNTEDDDLGGRPLTLATASHAGAQAVERALNALAGRRAG